MSRKVGIVWDDSFLEHNAGAGHPERPERLTAIQSVLQKRALFERCQHQEIRKATQAELELNHTPEHVRRVLDADGLERTVFDGDTQASPGTTTAALHAAAGAIDLARAVASKRLDLGFSFARPPGHHAEQESAMGFCYFNNVALAARALLEDGYTRIFILDWDVHHGNGTQHTFESDPRVLFCSLHQYPFYPGTGGLSEVGKGEGEGYTVNIPLPPMLGDDEYVFCFEHIVRPIAEQFNPEIILLSAGYDAHQRDPLGSMQVTASGFATLTRIVLELADAVCEGRCAAFLEGGYDLIGLSTSAAATLEVMLGDQPTESGRSEDADEVVRDILDGVRKKHAPLWNL